MYNIVSVSEAAKLLGISRVAILKRIKSGSINAEKVGNIYAINKDELPIFLEKELTPGQKNIVEKAVKKTINEYGETLRLLKDA